MQEHADSPRDDDPEVGGFLQPRQEQAPPSPREVRAARLDDQQAAATTTVSRQTVVSRTRRSILAGAAAIAAGGFAWGSLQRQAEAGNIPGFLRQGFEVNERIWSGLYDPGRLAPEFAVSDAEEIRVNGRIGLDGDIDLASWSMGIQDDQGRGIDDVDMATIMSLPIVDMVTEHKCIEGWSNIVHWTGVRFADVATRYEDVIADARFVSLQTPDSEYYVGLDMDTVMHPQSLLAFAWNGEMLTQERGAPLRLVTPLHYGIKSLKRLGQIRFMNDRPADYWAERGYDWDSSH